VLNKITNELNACLDLKEQNIISKIKQIDTLPATNKDLISKWKINAIKYNKVTQYVCDEDNVKHNKIYKELQKEADIIIKLAHKSLIPTKTHVKETILEINQ